MGKGKAASAGCRHTQDAEMLASLLQTWGWKFLNLPQTPTHPPARPPLSGRVCSLAALGEHHLAAGDCSSTVKLWVSGRGRLAGWVVCVCACVCVCVCVCVVGGGEVKLWASGWGWVGGRGVEQGVGVERCGWNGRWCEGHGRMGEQEADWGCRVTAGSQTSARARYCPSIAIHLLVTSTHATTRPNTPAATPAPHLPPPPIPPLIIRHLPPHTSLASAHTHTGPAQAAARRRPRPAAPRPRPRAQRARLRGRLLPHRGAVVGRAQRRAAQQLHRLVDRQPGGGGRDGAGPWEMEGPRVGVTEAKPLLKPSPYCAGLWGCMGELPGMRGLFCVRRRYAWGVGRPQSPLPSSSLRALHALTPAHASLFTSSRLLTQALEEAPPSAKLPMACLNVSAAGALSPAPAGSSPDDLVSQYKYTLRLGPGIATCMAGSEDESAVLVGGATGALWALRLVRGSAAAVEAAERVAAAAADEGCSAVGDLVVGVEEFSDDDYEEDEDDEDEDD